ncbi:Protein F37C4.5 [Colletotrichum higginsianum]|uniref:Protein F37C4.5 n=1 Tax=Colletotrichum higginsianum TaxID=80884 RepID=A0A4T0W0Q8_9PEZI|nr:Protein F37C4.5 [Colletotrichum higginsianum]
MDVIHHKEYHVRNLSTRSVTLFPSRAQIVRELKSLPLSPGTNEITIIGLTPTVDESTIKVDGTGSAVITDIAVELLPNRDIFEDIYPDSSDDASDAESDHDENVDEPPELPELSNLRSRLRQLRDEERRSKEFVESAASRLKILDAYGKSLDRKKSIDIVESIETYRTERERIFQDHAAGLAQGQANAKLLSAALKEESRLMKKQEREAVEAARERERARKERAKEKQKDAKRREERRREKERIRKERESFWPRVCYSVRVTLEAATLTPMSSRRTSVSSDTVQAFAATTSKSSEGSELLCDLSLSYVTSAASWSPSYDLQLFTTNNSGTLCYDARITNETSETWSNCKVILSTSQALFSGLENSIPTLKPWNIKLAPKNGQGSDILDSAEERLQRRGWWSVQQRAAQTSKPRSQLFGVDNSVLATSSEALSSYQSGLMLLEQQNKGRLVMQQLEQQRQQQQQQQQQSMPPQMLKESAPGGRGSFAFGASMSQAAPKASRKMSAFTAKQDSENEDYRRQEEQNTMEWPVMPSLDENVDFQESTVEETGFTTTYDLPGTKTLPPRPTPSKQRVARVGFSNIVFSHTVVAKYKPVAYLKAKIRNNSRLTLLRGETGLTLDGTFLGRARLPLCSDGDMFSLGLGVDPAIKVNYPKVDVRRTTTGLFSKENSSVYTRSITVANTRAAAGKPVSLFVLDQVPVSEDERLKVDVLAPKGLVVNGASVATGRPAREGKDDADWGKATALLRKGGQVDWQVTLNAGKAVKLGLEYVVALPSGDSAVEC